MKKILIFSISPGGVKKHIEYIVSNIDKSKFEIIGAFPYENVQERWGKKGENEYRHFFEESSLKYYIIDIPHGIDFFKDLKAIIKLRKILKNEKSDILHCHSSMAGFIGRIAGKLSKVPSIIYTPHTVYYAWLKGLKKHIFYFAEKFLTKFTDVIIAVSPSEEEYLKKTLKTDKVIRVNNGIDFDEIEKFKCNKLQIKKELNIPENRKTILTISRLSPPKDVFTILKAIKIVYSYYKNFVLLIAGDGEEKEEMQDFVKNENLTENVKFLGWREDIYNLICISDISILSSKREGLPYAVLEPSAFGKPVIGTYTTGIKDCIVHNETGFLFPVGDYNMLSKYILELLQNEKKCKRFGEKAKEFVKKNFNLKNMINSLEEIYEKY